MPSQTYKCLVMNRRNSLSAIFGERKAKNPKATSAPPIGTLNPYSGPWTINQASHLMRRTMFGPDQAQINSCLDMGLNTTVNTLFQNCVPSPPPVIFTLPEEPTGGDNIFPVFKDPFVDYGETWVNEPPIVSTGDPGLDQDILNVRARSVLYWPFINMMKPELNIMPKLWVFWHNHFVVSDFRLPIASYQYSRLLEDHAKGNFKELTKAMTIDVSMLLYLNGNENTKEAPNENYARELLELFTVGKGENAGPGDYTTFTEQDVQSMARALTGWVINLAEIDEKLESVFRPFRHDTEDKILSHRFNNEVISNSGENEVNNLIDIIFQQEAVSKHLSRKIYRYFLNHEITSEIEGNIIEPLAEIIREDNYNVERALKTLLSSDHFFSDEAIGCMIKNPCDFILSATRGLNIKFNGDPANDYFFSAIWTVFVGELDMRIFFHPDVAGWKAYYQEPQYYRNWINTYYLPKRNQTSSSITGGGPVAFLGNTAQIPQLVDVIDYISTIDENDNPDQLIYGIADNLFAYRISEAQKDYLKEILLPGLPDFEWTIEFTEYLSDPFNVEKRTAINNKLVQLFIAMLEMPEFQLM